MKTITPRIVVAWAIVSAGVAVLAACDQEITDPPVDEDVKSVEVVFGETTVTVDLAELEAVTFEDEENAYVRLSDVVEAAQLGVALDDLELDFEASDGFRSGARSTCVDHIPAPGAWLRQGYIHRITRNLGWDAELEMPGCTWVDDLARLLVSEAGSTRTTVEVAYDGGSVDVDLRLLDEVDFQGEPHARLADIVAFADLGVPAVNLEFDFEATDGFRASGSANCAEVVPLPGAQLESGYVNLATFDLVWDEAADLPGCLNVDDLALIDATDLAPAGPTVEVVYGGATVVVDLNEAEVVQFEGADQVRVSEVVELAQLGVALEDLVFDFVAGDGFRPSERGPCAEVFPMEAALLEDAYINLESRNLAFDPVLGLPGCVYVDDLARIEAFDAEIPTGPFLDVTYGETTVTVDLSRAEAVSFHGAPSVNLVDLFNLADLGVDHETVLFDFIASDGFRASEASSCAGVVPLAGDLLAQGYVRLSDRELDWEDEAMMPGCVHVHDLAELEAIDP